MDSTDTLHAGHEFGLNEVSTHHVEEMRATAVRNCVPIAVWIALKFPQKMIFPLPSSTILLIVGI